MTCMHDSCERGRKESISRVFVLFRDHSTSSNRLYQRLVLQVAVNGELNDIQTSRFLEDDEETRALRAQQMSGDVFSCLLNQDKKSQIGCKEDKGEMRQQNLQPREKDMQGNG